MSPANQTLLSRFAVATSVFALLMVGVVAATSDGSGGGGGEAADTGPVPVAASEFAFSPAEIVVPLGGSIELSNNGTMVHNAAVLDTPLTTSDLPAGESEVLDLSSLEPGTYELFCSIPGHKDSGMVATLTITDGSAGSEAEAEESATEAVEHAGHELGDLESTDPLAKRINDEMEAGMTGGVETFLANAERYAAGEIDKGNEILEPTEILDDGTKRFVLTAAITDWQVSPGNVVKAWTYNGMVPGPWIKLDEGDKVQVDVINELPISTDVHWHGLGVPNSEDGVAGITQDYIRPGETYTYEFTALNEPRLAMYHAHFHGQEAVLNGMFAIVQIGDVPLPAPGRYGNLDIPAGIEISQEVPMVLNDAGVIGLSLNGKAYPETEPIVAETGDWLLMHYYNEGLVGHPMHLHSQPHVVIAKDGYPLQAPYQTDTLWISPGERYTVLIKADQVGTWAFHCHILTHAENEQGLMGMVTAMVVTDPDAA